MPDRLSMLAEEFRLYKVETDDRLARLEAAANSQPVAAETTAQPPSPKKADTAS